MERTTGLNEDGLRFVSNLIIEKGPTTWPGRCLRELLQTSSFDWKTGLVDVHGRQVVGDGFNVSSEAWWGGGRLHHYLSAILQRR